MFFVLNIQLGELIKFNMEDIDDIHLMNIEEVLEIYETSKSGLSIDEANKREEKYGKNIIQEKEESIIFLFFRQFNNVLVYILLIASLISLYARKYIDFFAIAFLILANGLMAFFQELKAKTSIKALQKLTESKCIVLRDNKEIEIPSSDLVPGDVVVLSEGSLVSADIRLFESQSLMVDESSITGESMPVIKDAFAQVKKGALIYELKNCLLSGTNIVRGHALGIVTKTANNTYIASIAKQVENITIKTPLTKAIEHFSKRYAFFLIVLFSLIFLIGFFQKRTFLDLAYILIAELVSALPEGLPIVVTIVLVVGAIALSKHNTLVRHLPSVETLGSATVIATDKTGTITEGKLKVVKTFGDEEKLKKVAIFCNDAKNERSDPIDVALLKWADQLKDSKNNSSLIKSYPFDVNLRMMAKVYKVNNSKTIFIKGAFESLKELAINKNELKTIEENFHEMSSLGLRTIACGIGEFESDDISKFKINIVGLIGFLDPPKEHVKDAVYQAKKGGIDVKMITGDFALTAKEIAKQVGIYKEGDRILTGYEIEQLDEDMLYENLKKATVLARILPEHKYKIVKALQKHSEIVAVSGDGVNDVPALKAADLSIAMGSGSEAAKSVSKMIITDSNLKVIVDAIRNGRIIADNIRKVIYYLLSSALQEITLISISIILNLPLPLMPIQILWINLVTDGVQDKTFPFAKEDEDVMNKKPKKPQKQFFDKFQIINVLYYGFISGLIVLVLFKYLLKNYSYDITLTVIFTSVAVMQWANGIQAQKEKEPFFKNIKKSFTINPYIFLGIGIGIILQFLAVYVLSSWFSSVKIKLSLWIYPIIMFFVAFIIVESRKWLFLIFRRKK
ncbi:MAG: Calcium-transporting ATPase 1 [Candidatus Anoxychlamydiales bacterium]|nr:Calcium-transporting ATPase 1 [Candidatus Anoxychlamydiales bacterium]